MKVVSNLKTWFFNFVVDVSVSETTKLYVVEVFSRPEIYDMSNESFVLASSKANNFIDNQKIGDWSLWTCSFNHELTNYDLIQSIGMISYNRCYSLLGRKISVYEELANSLPTLTRQLNASLQKDDIYLK